MHRSVANEVLHSWVPGGPDLSLREDLDCLTERKNYSHYDAIANLQEHKMSLR
jgi:hypothetical protein